MVHCGIPLVAVVVRQIAAAGATFRMAEKNFFGEIVGQCPSTICSWLQIVWGSQWHAGWCCQLFDLYPTD